MKCGEEFKARGLFAQISDLSLETLLSESRVCVYVGFDPTCPTLQVGNLLPISVAMRLQRAGHRVILLVGGATGAIGDPSGKTQERQLLSSDEIAANTAAIREQLERFLDFGKTGATLVNNADWFDDLGFVRFLRDVGKHFTVNWMLAKESVRARLEDREQGISYTEFSYMLMQAFDFLWLYEHHGCNVQFGGDDQWGNITAGIELIRRSARGKAYGFTLPLLTTRDGRKFGKTEKGNLWLDGERTSPYEFYQFFLNVDDADVAPLLRYLTFMAPDLISELLAEHSRDTSKRLAQRALAADVTALVHGKEKTARAEQASSALFISQKGEPPTVEKLLSAGEVAPSFNLPRAMIDGDGVALVRLLASPDLALSPSLSGARRDIEGGGIYVNERRISEPSYRLSAKDLVDGRVALLRKGKKTYRLLVFDG